MQDKAATADTRRLASAVLGAQQKYSPVDCLVLTPDLTVVDVRPVHDLLALEGDGDWPTRYRAFLTRALAKTKK